MALGHIILKGLCRVKLFMATREQGYMMYATSVSASREVWPNVSGALVLAAFFSLTPSLDWERLSSTLVPTEHGVLLWTPSKKEQLADS